jgi:hypothetical protein
MKLTTTNQKELKTQTGTQECNGYAASCQKVLAQITATKEAILADAKQALAGPERLLRLALNEAEALAWQTTYPHLVFPVLAVEKIQRTAAWNATQQTVRRASPVFAQAA